MNDFDRFGRFTSPGGSVSQNPGYVPPPADDPGKFTLPLFTAKQYRVIEMVAKGMKNRQIAELLGHPEQVIKNYLRVIYDVTGVDSRLQLAMWWTSKKPLYVAAKVVLE
jgi:DNA-binding NarL/FixJ family response regulator